MSDHQDKTSQHTAKQHTTTAPAWVSARHMQYFLSLGDAFGLPVDELLSEAGLARAKLADGDSTIPVAALEFLLERLSQRFETPLIGLQLAGEVQPATFGVLGFLMQACATFGDVLNMITRFNGLLSNFGHTSLRHTPGEVHIQWDCRAGGAAFRRHACDYVLGSFVVLGRALLYGKSDVPVCVRLAHAAPTNPALVMHYHALFRCPVYFDCPVSELVLPRHYLATPLRHNDALVREALERHAEELLRKHQRADLIGDVRQLIAAMLTDTPPGKEVVARQLGMSGRSLHRALQKAGSSYQQLLDEARFARACELLDDAELAGEEVALRVGFQSRQSFIRWFKQESGQTPGDYRQQRQTDRSQTNE